MAKTAGVALLGLALLVSSVVSQQTLPGVGTDGQLDQCQVILGSYAAGDGTFDKDSSFQATINDGTWSVPLSTILNNTGDVLYVVPAARSANYAPLTAADRDQAGYCYDTLSLLPVYNPQAVIIPDETNNSVVVSPVSTVLAFGWAYGLREQSLHTALGLDDTVISSSYDSAAEFTADPSGQGSLFYKAGVKMQNLVTIGATLLSNSTESYAAFAVLMDQSLGRAALNASTFYFNTHSNSTGPQLDLNDPVILESIMWYASQYVHASKDYLLPTQLNSLDSAQYQAVALAAATLNEATDEASSPEDAAKALYYGQNTLTPLVDELASGSITPEDFSTEASPQAIMQGVSTAVLPSSQAQAPTAGRGFSGSDTQAADSSSSSSDDGLSGGAIAGIVIGCIAGVALIALAALMIVKRNNANRAGTTPTDSAPRRFWGRRQHDDMSTPNAV